MDSFARHKVCCVLPPQNRFDNTMKVRDAETGHEQWIDTSSAKLRNAHHAWWRERQALLSETFTKCNVDSVSVRTDQDYVKSLLNLFAKRS